MNKDEFQGKYEQIKGKLKATWGRLSDDELALYNGRRDEFFGKLQERYGIARQEAERTLHELEKHDAYRAA